MQAGRQRYLVSGAGSSLVAAWEPASIMSAFGGSAVRSGGWHGRRHCADHYPQLLQCRRNREDTLSEETENTCFSGVEQLVGKGQRHCGGHVHMIPAFYAA